MTVRIGFNDLGMNTVIEFLMKHDKFYNTSEYCLKNAILAVEEKAIDLSYYELSKHSSNCGNPVIINFNDSNFLFTEIEE